MKKKHIINLKKILGRFPWLKEKLRSMRHQYRYKNTRQLIRGRHQTNCTHRSIMHFSFNKAATQYIKSILVRCSSEAGLTHIGLNEYAFHTSFPFMDHLAKEKLKDYQYIFKSSGYLYSVFGGMVAEVPGIEKCKVILVVRDPRDILVSGYYSMAYSHQIPLMESSKRKNFLDKRSYAQEFGIDKYVKRESDKLLENYLRYEKYLLDPYDHYHITRYEDMIDDFRQWLIDILSYCELDVDYILIDELVSAQHQKAPKDENKFKHRRRGKPGDYGNKLKPETIAFLNEKLEAMLVRFNYV
ncbi:MAG: sulfotransferase domain-containing protein [Balneolaceae bacterium]|nr:sulfotransferase domain-containing protein [Balneolaceae bacterium]